MEDAMNDQIYFNGSIITLVSDNPNAEAMAVRDGKVLAVGTVGEVSAVASIAAKAIDLEGRTVVPGFNDSHAHLIEAGENLEEPDLSGLELTELSERLKTHSAVTPPDTPLISRGWDYEHLSAPSIQTLSRLIPYQPVLLFHRSGHAAWFNHAAFEHFGLGQWMDQEDNLWKVCVDASGAPLGILEEPYECPSVKDHLASRLQDPLHARRALNQSIPAYLEAGITSVQDNTWFPEVYSLYQREIRALSMTCWACGMEPRSLSGMLARRIVTDNFAVGPVKFFVDGALGSRTAWLWEPYRDDGDNCGNGLPADEIRRRAEPYVAQRRQLAIHAIGDRAVSELCDALESLERDYPWLPELRIRIEHAQLIREEDLPRLKRFGVVVSAQPAASGDFLHDVHLLGDKRAIRAYPHRSLLEHGIPLAFGSDFPFESTFDPLASMYILSKRPSPERIDPEDMLRAYTVGSAYAEFTEHHKGRLSPGMDADFAVLNHNPIYIGALPEALRVERTVRRGAQVFERKMSPLPV
jgi:predicted amidohydrolase YtcJ